MANAEPDRIGPLEPRNRRGFLGAATSLRTAAGVAYPSDWTGRTLMVGLMMQKPEFRADFEAIKTEVGKGLGLTP